MLANFVISGKRWYLVTRQGQRGNSRARRTADRRASPAALRAVPRTRGPGAPGPAGRRPRRLIRVIVFGCAQVFQISKNSSTRIFDRKSRLRHSRERAFQNYKIWRTKLRQLERPLRTLALLPPGALRGEPGAAALPGASARRRGDSGAMLTCVTVAKILPKLLIF